MSSVIAVAGFGEAEEMPVCGSIASCQNHRAIIPSDCPDRVAFRMVVAIDASRTCDFCELIAPDLLPFPSGILFALKEKAEKRIGSVLDYLETEKNNEAVLLRYFGEKYKEE